MTDESLGGHLASCSWMFWLTKTVLLYNITHAMRVKVVWGAIALRRHIHGSGMTRTRILSTSAALAMCYTISPFLLVNECTVCLPLIAT
jgi:hypothetical protein